MTCWAAALGNCGGGWSGEHIISESQFDGRLITISGLPWCKEPKTVGLASLVANHLCRDHNTALSPADAEAKRFREMVSSLRTPHPTRLDARLIERWLLKTTINLALLQPSSGFEPTEDLVRRAFGLAPTPAREGFFVLAEAGEALGPEQHIRFTTIVDRRDGRVVWSVFGFHGMRVAYAFQGAPGLVGTMRLRGIGADGGSQLAWEPDVGPEMPGDDAS